ncbi:hypothetical protein KO500_10245 [Cellulophaga baltica]|uniref:hypothetical protein n=1 Tax=Cellulophaga TaxID=104264 RepID=UPI001C072E3F|nr:MULTISPECIES: hypothetical protein [Cellulophaga]MBU2996818.1 hypothetical protein [Cellulophaga baltica]MDO6768214.1 hypothetical protein [Cellulophaga sp. 1_MG-2023]
MSDYEWKVNPLRKNADKNNLKELWKKAFLNNNKQNGLTQEQIFTTIWSNNSLKNDLFDLSNYPPNLSQSQIKNLAENDFITLVGNVNSKIYNFIKTQ